MVVTVSDDSTRVGAMPESQAHKSEAAIILKTRWSELTDHRLSAGAL